MSAEADDLRTALEGLYNTETAPHDADRRSLGVLTGVVLSHVVYAGARNKWLKERKKAVRYARRALANAALVADTEVKMLSVLVHLAIGEKPYARRIAEALIEQMPDRHEGWWALSVVCEAEGDAETADDAIFEAMKLAPEDPAVRARAVQLAVALGDNEEALQRTQDSETLHTNPEERFGQAQGLLFQGRYREAADALVAMARLNPHDPRCSVWINRVVRRVSATRPRRLPDAALALFLIAAFAGPYTMMELGHIDEATNVLVTLLMGVLVLVLFIIRSERDRRWVAEHHPTILDHQSTIGRLRVPDAEDR